MGATTKDVVVALPPVPSKQLRMLYGPKHKLVFEYIVYSGFVIVALVKLILIEAAVAPVVKVYQTVGFNISSQLFPTKSKPGAAPVLHPGVQTEAAPTAFNVIFCAVKQSSFAVQADVVVL